jgi:hypothetical protein
MKSAYSFLQFLLWKPLTASGDDIKGALRKLRIDTSRWFADDFLDDFMNDSQTSKSEPMKHLVERRDETLSQNTDSTCRAGSCV